MGNAYAKALRRIARRPSALYLSPSASAELKELRTISPSRLVAINHRNPISSSRFVAISLACAAMGENPITDSKDLGHTGKYREIVARETDRVRRRFALPE